MNSRLSIVNGELKLFSLGLFRRMISKPSVPNAAATRPIQHTHRVNTATKRQKAAPPVSAAPVMFSTSAPTKSSPMVATSRYRPPCNSQDQSQRGRLAS